MHAAPDTEILFDGLVEGVYSVLATGGGVQIQFPMVMNNNLLTWFNA
jgi:hypothetical protein